MAFWNSRSKWIEKVDLGRVQFLPPTRLVSSSFPTKSRLAKGARAFFCFVLSPDFLFFCPMHRTHSPFLFDVAFREQALIKQKGEKGGFAFFFFPLEHLHARPTSPATPSGKHQRQHLHLQRGVGRSTGAWCGSSLAARQPVAGHAPGRPRARQHYICHVSAGDVAVSFGDGYVVELEERS